MTPELKKKINLYEVDDMDYEEFRDVLTDNAILEDKLLPKGQINYVGSGSCSLESISHSEIKDYDKEDEFLVSLANMHNISVDNLKLVHSKYYLNTQSEDKIKIDILWETKDKEHVLDYNIFGVYFENKDDLDNTPNYRPSNSPYWEEWLVDFGINEDPHSQD